MAKYDIHKERPKTAAGMVPPPPPPPEGRKIKEGKNPPPKPESKKEKTYTEKQVNEFLLDQIIKCAKTIQSDNLSGYTARKKILETEFVKI